MSGPALARYVALERDLRGATRTADSAREATLQLEMSVVYEGLSASEREILDVRVGGGPPGGKSAGRVGQPRPWRSGRARA